MMKRERIITIEDFKRAPHRYVVKRRLPYYIEFNSHQRAVLLRQEEYEQLRHLAQYKSLIENIVFLMHNRSLEFLKDEPDLYENY